MRSHIRFPKYLHLLFSWMGKFLLRLFHFSLHVSFGGISNQMLQLSKAMFIANMSQVPLIIHDGKYKKLVMKYLDVKYLEESPFDVSNLGKSGFKATSFFQDLIRPMEH